MGASHARAIAAEGGRVVVGDVLEAEGRAVVEELGDAARFVRLDVRRNEDWVEAIHLAEKEFGKLNVLVNNAAVLNLTRVTETTDEEWHRVMSINVDGVFKGMRACAPAIRRAGGGSIINISSTAGMKGFISNFAYGTSKWAVRGMTKHGAMDLFDAGIRVNSIHPGNVQTRMMGDEPLPFEHVPMKRPAHPSEISGLVVFLASDESSFSTGAEFIADGGELTGIATLMREH